MADNDIFAVTFDRVWKKAYLAAMGDGSPLEVAQLCKPALGNFLHKHGCPQFEQFVALIEPLCTTGDQANLPLSGGYADIVEQADRLAEQCAGTAQGATALLAAGVCRVMALEANGNGRLVGEESQIFAQRLAVAITLFYFVDRLNCPEVLARFEIAASGNVNQAVQMFHNWRSELEQHLEAELQVVAAKLSADPSCKNVKVRKVRAPKRSAAEIQHMVLA